MRSSLRTALPALMALAIVAVACGPDATAPLATAELTATAGRNALEVRVTPTASLVEGNGEVFVEVAITNVSAKSVRVAPSQLPGEFLDEALFVVERDGQPVEYVGPHVKRAAPTADDMLVIAPQATVRYVVELSQAYDLTRDGVYSVRYASADAHGAPAVAMRSSGRSFELRGRVAMTPTLDEAAVTTAAFSLSFVNCTTTQRSQLTTAVNSARTYAQNSDAYLTNLTASSPRYAKWFGTFSTTNLATVRQNFSKIRDGFENQPITIDCKCNQRYYAYVYPNQPYKITVCKAFWSAPNTGTDSRAGTLIHEMSHFTVVAGTDDWAYGQSAAANLALTNVARAIDNADNHEYFAENTPILQ